jgi:precorrin-6A/cobalt-precorrin-6A reductase
MIWLIGGTAESVKIAELLTRECFPYLVSVTTLNAQNLYNHISDIHLVTGKIQSEQIIEFLAQHQLQMIIDATHPYATIISQQAIAAAQRLHIPYLRYERPLSQLSSAYICEFPSIDKLLASNYLEGKRVLLTLGYKSLPLFRQYHERVELYARILPYPESLIEAIKAGFRGDRLIAIRPPLSIDLEKALWQLWQIEVVVTKASGKNGGEDVKREISKELKIPLVVISRPSINYPQVTSDLEEVLKFCHQYSI